ncbi:cdc42 homolog [Argonauta hians]
MPSPKMTSELDESLDKSNIKCVLVGDCDIGKSCLAARIASNTFFSEYLPTLFDNYAVTVIVQNEPYVLSLFDTSGQDKYIRLRTMSYMKCDVFAVCFSVVKRDSYKHVSDVWLPEIRRYLPDTPFLLVGTQTDLRQSGGGGGGGGGVDAHNNHNNHLNHHYHHQQHNNQNELQNQNQNHLNNHRHQQQQQRNHDNNHHNHHHHRRHQQQQQQQQPVTQAEGVKMADRLGAHCYVECSALNHTGIQTVKHKLIRAAQDVGQGRPIGGGGGGGSGGGGSVGDGGGGSSGGGYYGDDDFNDSCTKCGCQIA